MFAKGHSHKCSEIGTLTIFLRKFPTKSEKNNTRTPPKLAFEFQRIFFLGRRSVHADCRSQEKWSHRTTQDLSNIWIMTFGGVDGCCPLCCYRICLPFFSPLIPFSVALNGTRFSGGSKLSAPCDHLFEDQKNEQNPTTEVWTISW